MAYNVKTYTEFINEHSAMDSSKEALISLQKWAEQNKVLMEKTNSLKDNPNMQIDGHDICSLVTLVNDRKGEYFCITRDLIYRNNNKAIDTDTQHVDVRRARYGGHVLTTGDLYLEMAYLDWVPYTEKYLKAANINKLDLTKRQADLIRKYYPEFARGTLAAINYNL